MKINSQDRPMYAERAAGSAAASKFGNQERSTTIGVSFDRVSISPAATLQLSNKILQTAMGKQLSAAFEKYGIDMNEAVGTDWSAEATASRIADFATGMLGVFRQQNPDLSESELVDRFENTIRGAIDDGYAQAQQILGSMDIAGGAPSIGRQTIDLVHQKLDDFFAQLREPRDAQAQQPAVPQAGVATR